MFLDSWFFLVLLFKRFLYALGESFCLLPWLFLLEEVIRIQRTFLITTRLACLRLVSYHLRIFSNRNQKIEVFFTRLGRYIFKLMDPGKLHYIVKSSAFKTVLIGIVEVRLTLTSRYSISFAFLKASFQTILQLKRAFPWSLIVKFM